ncbi:MAG TPA: hypothetical protein VFO69_11815 [Allosphingosinicella sp.]|nr:hypothetical protein [Allosphingosinicella sp.]
MSQSMTLLAMASFGLAALIILTYSGLKAWHGWLEVKRLELAGHRHSEPRSQAMDMIEMADLKERIRKLENIAACIDL